MPPSFTKIYKVRHHTTRRGGGGEKTKDGRNKGVDNKFWGYVSVCVQLYCRWFTVLRLVVAVPHYMFRPTWPSSGVYDVLLLYSWRNLLRCFCCLFLHVVSSVFFSCVFSLVFWFLCVRFCLESEKKGQTTRNGKQANTHTRIRKLTKKHSRKTQNENVHSVTTCKKG
jgi:hypothetical protein